MKIIIHLGLYIAVIFSAIEVVKSRHDTRELFREKKSLLKAQDQFIEQWGRLRLEYGAWSINDRIDQHARNQLGMKKPIGIVVVLTK
jgi:cell division protein FtsL|tara:strand:+ start:312 stop:572 length:261 start_codon:yes stop_codon:yes gene_type:complete